MTRTESLLYLFQTHGNRLTLGQMLAYGHMIGSKYTSRIDDLRKQGHNIVCSEKNREHPTENVYLLLDPIKTGSGELQRAFA